MTVGDIIDRVNRDYLLVPGEQPIRFTLQNLSGTAVTSITGSSSDDVIASTAHGLSAGDTIVFTALTGGTGLSTYTTYYVINPSTDTFQVSLTEGGSAVTFADFTGGTYQETAAVTATDKTIVVNTDILQPEEEDLIGVGTLLELDSEIVMVEAVSGSSPSFTLTLRRGMLGTTAATHSDGIDVLVAGDDYIPRFSIFEAVADAVEALWPDLWTVGVEETFAASFPVELPATAGEVLHVRVNQDSRWTHNVGWEELQDFPLSSTGNAVQIYGATGSIQVYYKKKPTRPTAEANTLSDLGVESGWVKVVVLAAVASLVARMDLSKATSDFITQSLEAEGFAPGEGTDIRNGLLQLEEFQMQPLKRQLSQMQHQRVYIDDRY